MPVDSPFWIKGDGRGDGVATNSRSGRITWGADDVTFINSDAVLAHGDFPVANNSPWPNNPLDSRKCLTFGIKHVAGREWEVIGNFQIPLNGQPEHEEDPEENPLTKKPEILVRTQSHTVPTDVDVDGNAIVNSAGEPLLNPPFRTLNSYLITYRRNEASYNVPAGAAYENKVSSGAWNGMQAREPKCLSIQPTQYFTLTATYVEVEYQFEYRPVDAWGQQPHQARILDEGYKAWAILASGGARPVELYEKASKTPVRTPVLLDGFGAPLNPDYFTYADDEQTFDGNVVLMESPTWASAPSTPTGMSREITPNGVIIRYQDVPEANFGPLGITL